MTRKIKPYIEIARPDHWFKNVFMIPGVILAFFDKPQELTFSLIVKIVFAFLIVGIIASSNYVLNEIIDAPSDKHHPSKKMRPLPAGRANSKIAFAVWCALSFIGLLLSKTISPEFFICAILLWVAGLLYNIPPIRFKDKPFADVVSESFNNPLRLMLGWFATNNHHWPTLSLIMAYWMFGAFFMTVKRLGEYRHVADKAALGFYRKSFRYYNEEKLLTSIIFYASAFAMFYGIFLIRYRIELILSVPLIAGFMGAYLRVGFMPDSPAQYPEKLYKQKGFVLYTSMCSIVLIALLFIDIPGLENLFQPLHMPKANLP